MIVGNAVRQVIGIAKAKLGQDSDITTIVQPIEDWAGVKVGAKKT
jgi:2-hydroxy-3-oxopropionate reductase